jgi:hypothetical protein
MKYLHRGQKINKNLLYQFCNIHIWWFVQYLGVGHNICMFNEKNDEIRKYKTNCDFKNRKK